MFTPRSRQASSEATDAVGRRLTCRIEEGRDEDDQKKLHQHHPDRAHRAEDPADDLPGIGRQARGEISRVDGGDFLPSRGEPRTDEGQPLHPVAYGPLAGKNLRWLMEHHPKELLGPARSQHGKGRLGPAN